MASTDSEPQSTKPTICPARIDPREYAGDSLLPCTCNLCEAECVCEAANLRAAQDPTSEWFCIFHFGGRVPASYDPKAVWIARKKCQRLQAQKALCECGECFGYDFEIDEEFGVNSDGEDIDDDESAQGDEGKDDGGSTKADEDNDDGGLAKADEDKEASSVDK